MRGVWQRKKQKWIEKLMLTDKNGQIVRALILDVPPPPNLVGFRTILVRYIDQIVIGFFHNIRHLLQKVEITVLFCNNRRSYDVLQQIAKHFWPLISQGIVAIVHLNGNELSQLMKLTSPSVFRECAKLRCIYCSQVFPESPSYDGTGASVGQALSKWLHTPRADGRPKVLKCVGLSQIEKHLEDLKMAFISAESPVSYVICLDFGIGFKYGGQPFEWDNARTRERMTFRYIKHIYSLGVWLLRRGPIGWDESEWSESEKRAQRGGDRCLCRQCHLNEQRKRN
ncbi:hypothetical protein niasHT_014472 [Heterodera trifolii]|uniref:Uncharacterized protein n=2 Tax=Heterodera trifolii TaxID=157864 RepID=A0ABD2KZF7_9BILA